MPSRQHAPWRRRQQSHEFDAAARARALPGIELVVELGIAAARKRERGDADLHRRRRVGLVEQSAGRLEDADALGGYRVAGERRLQGEPALARRRTALLAVREPPAEQIALHRIDLEE